MRPPAFVVALASAATVTATAGVLVLRLQEPAPAVWVPFAAVVAGVVVALAGVGAVRLAQALRARRWRARFRDEGLAMAEEGYFQTGPVEPAVIGHQTYRAAYDIPDLHDVFPEEER